MPIKIERRTIEGIVGPIEVALDWPSQSASEIPQGFAFIGHPHPLFGGTLDNKVAATLARTFAGLGFLAVRPNFRGVGNSAGTHDHGNGETDDFLHVMHSLPQWLPHVSTQRPRVLAGFSFGSFVAAKAANALLERDIAVERLILVGAAAGKWPMPPVRSDTLVVHGERDETIPLADVMDWARPQELPVVVMPGADHFFHRRLSQLKQLVAQHVIGRRAIDAVGQSD